MTTTEFLRSQAAADMDPVSTLQLPLAELLDVTPAAAAALGAIGLHTVFDLAASWQFANAGRLAAAGDITSTQERYAVGVGDLLAEGVNVATIPDLARAPVAALRGPTPAQADALTAALGVADVREMSLWPPYRAARAIVSELLGGSVLDGACAGDQLSEDDRAAEALRPQLGEFPTERLYYSTLVMLGPIGEMPAPDKHLTDTSPLDVGKLASYAGATAPAIGALLTFEQSWYAQGVTLGQLLHSLALAPGEATRIAVIDWARRTSAMESETVSQAEQLSNSTFHSRSLSEVQKAVADEAQEGFSETDTTASSSSSAFAVAAGTGLIPSLFVDADVSGGGQQASSHGSSTSSSWTTGHRQIKADLTQKVQDRTEQHASSTRNRRASAVREVSQTEHESVSTRIVANYNHMHALTVQYWEVVELFRVACRLHRAERLLFLPMKTVTFDNATIDRFRAVLRRAALNGRIAELLANPIGSVAVRPVLPVRSPNRVVELVQAAGRAVVADRFRVSNVARIDPELLTAAAVPLVKTTPMAAVAAGPMAAVAAAAAEASKVEAQAAPGVAAVANHLWMWSPSHVASIARATGVAPLRNGSDDVFVPADTTVESVAFRGGTPTAVLLEHANGDMPLTLTSGIADVPAGVSLADITAVSTTVDTDATMVVALNRGGRRFTIDIPIKASAAPARAALFDSEASNRGAELRTHLNSHADYYSRAIWASLSSADVTALVADLEYEGTSLAHKIDPKPLTIAGNYLVVRAPAGPVIEDTENADGSTWSELLRTRLGIPSDGADEDERLIPLPSGGVFAEAVLGRANSAEKLDLTRFWHWQDSPIPLTPPEIAPVTTGSRGTAEDLRAGDLSNPLVNIVSPTTLPSPDSTNSLLSALATGNMFRDMSGLAGNQQLLGSAMSGTMNAATAAGQLASDNLRTEAQKSVAMAQVWGDIIKSALGAATGTGGGGGSSSVTPITGASGAGKMSGISAAGAQINHGRDMDGRGLGAGSSKTGAADAGGADVGADGGGAPGSAVAGQFSHEAAYANQSALGYSPEAAGGLSDLLQQVQHRTGGAGAGPARTAPLISTAPPSDAVIRAAAGIEVADGLSTQVWFTGNVSADFPTWFARNVAMRGAWGDKNCGTSPATIAQFEKLMDLIPAIYGPDATTTEGVHINLLQVLSLAAIAINETRTFVPVPEDGDLRYIFERNAKGKASYNKNTQLANRTALSLFQSAEFQAAHATEMRPSGFNPSDPAWGETVWPAGMPINKNDPTSAYLRQADFWKFRGHGYIQLTGRTWFRRLVEEVVAYQGAQPLVKGLAGAWQAAIGGATGAARETAIDGILTTSKDQDWDKFFTASDLVGAVLGVRAHKASLNAMVNLSGDPAIFRGTRPGSLHALGVAMNGTAYGELFQRRVFQMLNALAHILVPPPAASAPPANGAVPAPRGGGVIDGVEVIEI